MARKLAAFIVLLVVAVAATAIYVTPWPSVWVIRAVFDRGAERASAALEAKGPGSLAVDPVRSYDPADRDAMFDIYRGKGSSASGPVIVWFHGGGFVSGRRGDVTSRIPASSGVRPPLRRLQETQQVTMFSQSFRPPWATGMT